jgi:hypothetical protein
MFISSNKVASKIIDLFSNNQISQNQWKFDIPDDITDEHLAIVATAKNFADGIQYSLDRKGIDIPEEIVVSSREYKQYINSEGGITKC